MSTTNLFVELIIIGLGSLSFIVFNFCTMLNIDIVRMKTIFTMDYVVPLVAGVYLLGIIFDRLADTLFEGLATNRLKKRYFGSNDAYYRQRLLAESKDDKVSEKLEYGRSRMRICRGSSLNLLLIIVSINLYFYYEKGVTHSVVLYSNTGLMLLLLACVYSWHKLIVTEYRRIKEYVTISEEMQQHAGANR